MSIQSCSRNPQHQMKNNMNNNHTIDSVANTVIPGQALEGVLITGQGQARAVPPPLLKITKIQMKVNCQTLLLLRISLILIIMGIQSRSRNPRHQMNNNKNNKNNKNNHIIHSVASTVIPGQALEDVPITSQGQAKAVPHRYQAQNLHHRLLEMKANLNPCHHHNRLGGMGFGNPCLQNRLAKAFTYTEPGKRHPCSRLSFHQMGFSSLQIHATPSATCD
jgi:hypothetical protein